jgi:hypothetical protein
MSYTKTCCNRERLPLPFPRRPLAPHPPGSFHDSFTMKNTILPNARAYTISPFVVILRAGCLPAHPYLGRKAALDEAESAIRGR